MNSNIIEEAIKNNTSQLTIEYAIKILERANIFISTEDANSDIEKFSLLKTLAADLCFACELLLKTKINDYQTENGFSSWRTHNILNIFDKLNDGDKSFIYNELNLSSIEVENILQNDSTSNAFIKRYLYEPNTGIPNYNFLCDFANALLKLNNKQVVYDLKKIDTLSEQFNTTQFDFENIIKEHSSMIYRKSQIFDLGSIHDEIEAYIVKNMKSCDYALFSELRYKYFDKNKNPKKEHEFSQLHKRLDDACKFLVAKSRYMDRYMSKDSTIDFYWALESLMFNENFNVGNTTKELYSDLNETFEKSRYCTIEYFDNYYNSFNFTNTIKSITDLLMMNRDKANQIIENKNELLESFGLDFLQRMAFTVDEMESIDIEYIKRLEKLININKCPKSILLENDNKTRDKIFYFINAMPVSMRKYVRIPICIDYIVEMIDSEYSVNMDKYNADVSFQDSYLNVNKNKIDEYIQLSRVIMEKRIIIHIIENNLDLNVGVTRYLSMINICETLSQNKQLITDFVNDFGPTFIKNGEMNKLKKSFLLYNYFTEEGYDALSYRINDMEKLYKIPFEKIVNTFASFKIYGLEDMFFHQIEAAISVDPVNLQTKLKKYKENQEFLSNCYDNADLFNTDIDKLVDFLKKANLKNGMNLGKFNSGEIEKTYDLLKSKNLLFLYNADGFINAVENNEILDEILNQKLILEINDNDYDELDKKSVGLVIKKIFENRNLKKFLLDILNSRIVIEHPKSLQVFNSYYSTLENIYRINIYNTWYEKTINNNIICNGSKITLDNEKIEDIANLFVEELSQPQNIEKDSELSNRLESIFSNSQLVYSMNKEIFSKYNIDFMNKVVKDSNFRFNDFSDFNYFANLFETIDSNGLSEDKILNLLNQLHKYKNNTNVADFVKKICSCKKLNGFCSIKFEDEEGIKEFNNELLDYLIIKINDKDENEINNYIINTNITINDLMEEIPDNLVYEGDTYEEKRKSGVDILDTIKNIFMTNIIKSKNEVLTRIANSYIANKIKIHKLNKAYNQIMKKEDQENGKKR